MAAVSTTRAKPFSIDCNTTTVKVVRNVKGKGDKIRRMAIAEAFITRYRTVADAKSGRVATVEMEIADWIYDEVAADSPMVLTMHPRHFRIEQGIGCFVYRLAQIPAAGRTAPGIAPSLTHRKPSFTHRVPSNTLQIPSFTHRPNPQVAVAVRDFSQRHHYFRSQAKARVHLCGNHESS
jgi:hypothetical protein